MSPESQHVVLPIILTLELRVSRRFQRFDLGGDFICIADASDSLASVDVYLESTGADPITMRKGVRIKVDRGFTRFFVSNAVQGTKTLTLSIGSPDSVRAGMDAFLPPTVGNEGTVRDITGTDPAAGAQVAEAPPSGFIWRLLWLRVTFITNGVAGARNVGAILENLVTFLPSWREYELATQIANQSVQYFLAPGVAHLDHTVVGSVRFAHLELPREVWVTSLIGLRVQAIGMDPGDNFQAPQMVVEEFEL